MTAKRVYAIIIFVIGFISSASSMILSSSQTNDYEDFFYYGYMPIDKNEIQHNLGDEVIDKVRFAFEPNNGRIIVSMMDGDKVIETSSIIPSESTLKVSSNSIIILYKERSANKSISLFKSFLDGEPSKLIYWINKDTGCGKVFGTEFDTDNGIFSACKYQGKNFNIQYNSVKNKLEKFSWMRR